MSTRLIFLTSAIIFLFCLITSCSGSNTGNNIVPSPIDDISDQPGRVVESQRHLWAFHDIHIDPGDGSVEVIPKRLVEDHFNVLKFIEEQPCDDCLKVLGIEGSGQGTILIHVELTHPFPGYLSLTGFDVRGVVIFNGSKVFPTSGLSIPDRSSGDCELYNADGFTSLYNYTTEGAGIHGYKGYIQGTRASWPPPEALLNGYKRFISDDPDNTRNAFFSGDAITVTYDIAIPASGFYFGYAVDACWVPPINEPVTDPMTDFPPDANSPEAWKIDVTEDPIDAGINKFGGASRFLIDVYDWEGPDHLYPPIVECPELFDGFLAADFTGEFDGYCRYEVVVSNHLLPSEGTYKLLIGKRAIEYDPYRPWMDLTAYQVYPIEISGSIFNLEDITPDWLNFSPYGIDCDETRVFTAGNLNGIHVFSILDPAHPEWMKKIEGTEGLKNIAISGNYAYSTKNFGCGAYFLRVIDISSPMLEYVVKTINIEWAGRCMAIVDKFLYVGCSQGMMILGIADPLNPVVLGMVETEYYSDDITVSGHYAYLASKAAGMYIIDVADPFHPTLVNTIDAYSENADNVVSDGEYAYLSLPFEGIWVIDVNPPGEAEVVHLVDVGGIPEGLELSGDYVYVCSRATTSYSVQVIDISDPVSAEVVASSDSVGSARQIRLNGNYAYVTNTDAGLLTVDIDPPVEIENVDMIYTIGSSREMDISDGYAYVINNWVGLQTVDIDPLESAKIIHTMQFSEDLQDVVVIGNYAYLAGSYKLYIVNITNKTNPFVAKIINSAGGDSLVIHDGYAYAGSHTKIRISDIDPLLSAAVVNTVETPMSNYGLYISDGYLFSPSGDGLVIYNIDFPTNINVEKFLPDPGFSSNFMVANGYAFSSHYSDKTLTITDVDPVDGANVVKIIDAGSGLGVGYTPGYVFHGTYGDGITIYDVDPPESAYEEDFYYMGNGAYNIDIRDDIAFVLAGAFGFRIISIW